jgi:hypothetical protein
MADDAGQALLAGTAVDWHRGLARVAIAEGVPDFLSWATRLGEAAEDFFATFGIVAGSWSAALAARIPDGAQVYAWTDHDAAGDRYAAFIAATFGDRCRLSRSAPA